MILGLLTIERNHVLHLLDDDTQFNTKITTYKLLGIPIFKLKESLEVEDPIIRLLESTKVEDSIEESDQIGNK